MTFPHHELGPGSLQVVDPGQRLRPELRLPELGLGRGATHRLLDVRLCLVLGVDLFPKMEI